MSYPWIRDSNHTGSSETDYLQITSPKGLYLNSTTSGTNSNAIFMQGFIQGTSDAITCYYYCDQVRYYPNVWNGITLYSQQYARFADNTATTYSQIDKSGLTSVYGPTNSSTYFQSSNNGNFQTIVSINENIYISSNNGSGAIYFSGTALYLNGSPIGGGIGQITSSNGSINITNPYGPTVDITTSGGGSSTYNGNYPIQVDNANMQISFSPFSGNDVNFNSASINGVENINVAYINGIPAGQITLGINNIYAGNNISIDTSTYGPQNPIINASGGGGGGNVYWSQLVSTTTTYENLYNESANFNINFGIDASSYGPQDVAKLCIDNKYESYIGYNYQGTQYPDGTYKAGYLKVGYDDNNYTLLTNTNSSYLCTMATIGSDMYLFANKQQQNQNGSGTMYLYAKSVLCGNGGGQSDLGDGSYYWNNVYANGYPGTSDIKLKDNVTQLDLAYSTNLIKNLNPVSYTFKSDKESKKRFGLIAQEVEKIIGSENLQLCLTNNDTKSLCYMELISPLIKTVQDLLKRVEDLEFEVKELKK